MTPPTRVYAPTTQKGLLTLAESGHLGVFEAFAVTDRLRASQELSADDPAGDELAEAALVAAADACLELLATEVDARPRRVVIAADVATDPAGVPGAHPAAVACPTGIARSQLVCVLADDLADAGAAAAVARAVAAQSAGADELEAALDALDEYALAWFDASELAALAAGGC